MIKATTALVAAALIFALPAVGAATTCNSVAACLLGNNTGSGVGLEGVSQRNVGLYGVSTNNHGIDGRSRNSYGVVGYTYAAGTTAQAGVFGIDESGYNSGVEGDSKYSYGVVGKGEYGVEGIGTSNNGPAFNPGIGVFGVGTTSGGFFESQSATEPTLIIANNGAGPVLEGDSSGHGSVIQVDNMGNLTITGTLYEIRSPEIRTRTVGADVTSYAARTSSPTLEDFGTSRLMNGAAIIPLDPTFASAIDPHNYMVFITPHGNSNGLYAETAATGFTVRENNGGHSTVAFDYRIVSKPIDAKTAHLPVALPLRRNAMSKFRAQTTLRGQPSL